VPMRELSDDRQAHLSVGSTAQHFQPEVRADRGVVHEVLTDALNAHRSDVDVAPDSLLGDVHTNAVDVLAGHNAFHDLLRVDAVRLLLVLSARVEASILIHHAPRLSARPSAHAAQRPCGSAAIRQLTDVCGNLRR
jgi:hypothetical protein